MGPGGIPGSKHFHKLLSVSTIRSRAAAVCKSCWACALPGFEPLTLAGDDFAGVAGLSTSEAHTEAV